MDVKYLDFLLVGLGGIFGAIFRFTIGLIISVTHFPFSTLIVNIIGSIILGFLVSLYEQDRISHNWMLFLGVGMMGSLTTMSTFGVETINAASVQISSLNIIVSLIGVLLGVLLGKFLANLI